jgi:NDP-sugar pyrophosphorylase family protein
MAKKNNLEGKYIVRHYDGFDRYWIDVSEPVSKEEAQRIWNKETKNGTENTCYEDIDYYRIFPADTRMLYNTLPPDRY